MSSSAATSNDAKKGLWEEISHTWLIKNRRRCSGCTVDYPLKSNTIFNKLRDCKWQVQCYYSSNEYLKPCDYFNIGLHLETTSHDVFETKFTLSVKNANISNIKTVQSNYGFTYQSNIKKFPQFIPWSELITRASSILEIHLELFVKVSVVDKQNNVFTLGSDFPETRLQKSMNELFESSNFTDIVFEVEEAKLKAHQCILSARSPVFAAMFTYETTEKHSGVVKIMDFSSDSFRRFLHFVYAGKVDITSVDTAADLFRAAEKYDFPDLKPLCMNFISPNLNSSNVGPLLLLAETFFTKDLKEMAMDYILENLKIEKDVEMEVYTLIEQENPKLLTELLIRLAQNRN